MRKTGRRSHRRSHKKRRKFGSLPPFPPKVDEYTTQGKIGTVLGSLAFRKAYLDNPEYEKLARKIQNNSIKEVRDDTLIESFVKFSKEQGYDISYKKIKELLLFYNVASVLSSKIY